MSRGDEQAFQCVYPEEKWTEHWHGVEVQMKLHITRPSSDIFALLEANACQEHPRGIPQLLRVERAQNVVKFS